MVTLRPARSVGGLDWVALEAPAGSLFWSLAFYRKASDRDLALEWLERGTSTNVRK